MSLSSLIGPQIPLLRRYARALTGSQASGDAYVAALLETLLADPSLSTATPSRVRKPIACFPAYGTPCR